MVYAQTRIRPKNEMHEFRWFDMPLNKENNQLKKKKK